MSGNAPSVVGANEPGGESEGHHISRKTYACVSCGDGISRTSRIASIDESTGVHLLKGRPGSIEKLAIWRPAYRSPVSNYVWGIFLRYQEWGEGSFYKPRSFPQGAEAHC